MYELIDYGIQKYSNGTINIFVGPMYLYVFKNKFAKMALPEKINNEWPETSEYKGANQTNCDFITGVGYAIPWKKIEGIKEYTIPEWIRKKYPIPKGESLKGKWAEKVAQLMIEEENIVDLKTEKVTMKGEQIKGVDLQIKQGKIQVKCDAKSGRNGYGNIFLQVKECNPNGIY